MLNAQEIGALVNIIATAREKNQGYPATEHIDVAIVNAEVRPGLDTSIELVAAVAAQAGGLQDGAADAFDWVANAAARIARELRAG